MKIIHTSDLHLNSPLSSKLPSAKISERRRELSTLLRRLAAEADRVGAEAIIIAGDMFDSDRLNKKNRDRALSVIEAAKHITFFYLPGNHEKDAFSAGDDLPQNLKVFTGEWGSYSIGDVAFTGCSETKSDMFSTAHLDKSKVNIVVLHGELRDRCGDGGVIGIKDARGLGADYFALGHYHTYSVTRVDERAIAVYSGTPEGRGFDEAGEKGYVLVSIENGSVQHKFVNFANRCLRIVDVDISSASTTYEISRLIEDTISAIPACDLVRVRLVGHYDIELKKDIGAILSQFSGRFYFFELKDESRLLHSPDSYKHDVSLKGEFIRLVLADGDLCDEEREQIISCGLSALAHEAFDE